MGLINSCLSSKQREIREIYMEIEAYKNIKNSKEKNAKELYLKLSDLSKSINNFFDKYPNTKIDTSLKQFNLQEEIIDINNNFLKPLEKNIHFVWVGGRIPNIAIDYINQWKEINPDYQSTIWYDSQVLLLNILKKSIIELSNFEVLEKDESFLKDTNQMLNKFFDERFKIILKYQSEFNLYYKKYYSTKSLNDIIKSYLVAKNIKNEIELNEYISESINIFKTNNAKDIRENHILEDNVLKSIYEQELLKRFNFAAASDIIRVILLKKFGGIYLDVDMLPGIKKSVFEGIIKPKDFSDSDWQRAKLQVIMNSKHYINGYGNSLLDKLPNSTLDILQKKVNELKHKNDIFESLGNISISELSVKTAFHFECVINQVIISKKNSYLLDLIINQIKNRYSIINEGLSEITSNLKFNDISNVFYKKLLERYKNQEIFISKVSGYLCDGYIPNVRATIYISGPGIYSPAYFDFLYFRNKTLEPVTLDETLEYQEYLKNFMISQNLVSQLTEEESDSSWTLNEKNAQNEFEKLIKDYNNRKNKFAN